MPMPQTTPPAIWLRAVFGLRMRPAATALTTRVTRMTPSCKVVHGASSSCFEVPLTVSAIAIFLGKGVGVAMSVLNSFADGARGGALVGDVAPRSAGRETIIRLRPHHLALRP